MISADRRGAVLIVLPSGLLRHLFTQTKTSQLRRPATPHPHNMEARTAESPMDFVWENRPMDATSPFTHVHGLKRKWTAQFAET